jgi:mannose-6-phosphate isomerase
MEPLVFEPYLRPMVWGQRRLGTQLHKALPTDQTFGEAWEISVHPHHVSRVAEGPFRGMKLTDLCERHAPEIFGDKLPSGGQFPLLIKLLDCHDWLSIQVHPTDELAPQLSREALGKTEAWVIMAVEPGGKIFAGLKPGVTREVLQQHLEAGTTDQCLHSFTPNVGDCLYLPAGTVHAVGGGVVMAEVQQSSDATFRLFDWNRLGTDGKPRQLHIRESLEAINWNAGPVEPIRPKPLASSAGVDVEELVRCAYFHMARVRMTSPFALEIVKRMRVCMILDGSAELSGEDGYRRTFHRGETVLVPALHGSLRWVPGQGKPASLLEVVL